MIDNGNHAPKQPKPRYDLTADELSVREHELVEVVKQAYPNGENLFAVWMPPENEFADIVRTHESVYWPTMEEIMEPHEERSLFLALVDTRGGRDEVVHGTRISGGGILGNHSRETMPDYEVEGTTGLVLIDDIINSGQGLTAVDFRKYYEDRGFDTSKFISVETNFRRPNMETRVERYNGLPASQVGYVSLFQFIDKEGLQPDETAIFASLNQASIDSLKLLGAEYEALMGRDDLMTPIEDEKFDPDYKPVAILASEANITLFREISSLGAPVIYL